MIFSVDSVGIGLLLVAFVLVLGALVGVLMPSAPLPQPMPRSEGPVFLFDGDQLIDCNSAAKAILSRSVTRGGDWQRLMSFLSKNFESIEDKLAGLAQKGALVETAASANGKAMLLQAELNSGILRISLDDPDLAEGEGVALAMSHRALESEVHDLRKAISRAPILMWRESETSDVIWANDAYMVLAASNLTQGRNLSWPLPRIFDRAAAVQSAHGQRQCVNFGATGTQKTAWFDLQTKADGADILCFALPVDAAVAAENSLRDFMDTLAKTFAQLPIGLAVFDKERRLHMFNPAMVELTTLPADFLARKPSILAVLDAMRDRNLLPEPKDYRSWRRQMIEMERAAASGLFQEDWPLPDGQTFRVTGRPHPNGGLALMFEDISGEMQRSRRYRADLEISQSVIDQLDDGIIVFNQSGHLLWCNAAYAQLWGDDPAASLGEVTLRSLIEGWKTRSAPTQLWLEIDEYIHTVGIRTAWDKDLRLLDGRLLCCSVSPVAAGSTMISFKKCAAAQTPRTLEPTKSDNEATAA